MKRAHAVKVLAAGLFIIFAAAIVYLFLWGRLFPYSPVIIGFTRHELPRTVVYVQKGTEFDAYAAIDSLIPAVEKFHELTFKKKPELFVFRDKKSYLRHSPSKARFCAFSSGRLVISPWVLREAREGRISLEVYVRHELSHVLLFQYKGLLSEFRYPNWLLEGIAVYSTNQMGTSFYPGREETYALMRKGNFMPPRYFHTSKEDCVKLDVPYRMTFMYSEFACIVDRLVETYGREKFLVYMKKMLDRDDHDAVFKEVFEIEFDGFLTNLQKAVQKTGVAVD